MYLVLDYSDFIKSSDIPTAVDASVNQWTSMDVQTFTIQACSSINHLLGSQFLDSSKVHVYTEDNQCMNAQDSLQKYIKNKNNEYLDWMTLRFRKR